MNGYELTAVILLLLFAAYIVKKVFEATPGDVYLIGIPSKALPQLDRIGKRIWQDRVNTVRIACVHLDLLTEYEKEGSIIIVRHPDGAEERLEILYKARQNPTHESKEDESA